MARRKSPTTGKPPEAENSALLHWLKQRRITEVECLVPDMTGIARGKIIPAAKFSHDYGTRLPEGIFVTTVTGDYPDEYYELVSPSDSDMFLRPDAETVRMVPWAVDPTAAPIRVQSFRSCIASQSTTSLPDRRIFRIVCTVCQRW